MSEELQELNDDSVSQSAETVVHALFRFFWVLRRRMGVIVSILLVAGLLGALYYGTATRTYQSSASLLVIKSSPDLLANPTAAGPGTQGLMPTYESLLKSTVVLEGAIGKMQQLPPEMIAGMPREAWVGVLRRHLSTSTIRRTNIIEMRYRSQEPQASVAAINAIVGAYLEFVDRNHKNVAAELVGVLSRERAELETRLMRKEHELLDAKRKFGDLGLRNGSTAVHPIVERAIKTNQALIKTSQRRIELEASLAAIRRAVRDGGDLRQHLIALKPLVGPKLLMNSLGMTDQDEQVLAKFEQAVLDDRAKLKAALGHYGPAHPQITELNERIRNAEHYLASFHSQNGPRQEGIRQTQLGPTLLALVEEELSQVVSHEQNLQKHYRESEAAAVSQNNQMAELSIVEHDLNLLRNLHDVLLNRIASIDINENAADVRVTVISEPTTPGGPVSPRLSVVGMICLMGGLGCGVLVVFVLDVMDDRFRSPEEVQNELGVPVLAMVRKHEPLVGEGVDLVQVHVAPDAVESEAYRTMRTALAFSGDEISRLVVSSAEPSDGKTTIISNLAASFAQSGKKTLLIDGDLRRPGLTNLFAMRGVPGVTDMLKSDEPIAELGPTLIRPTGIDGLDILPCGPRPADPSTLLSSERLPDFFAWAETKYGQILMDSPPVLAASDAAIIGKSTDGLILVIQPNKNHRRRVLRAQEELRRLGIPLVGAAVNVMGSESESLQYGYDTGYGYGYGYAYEYRAEEGESSADSDGRHEDSLPEGGEDVGIVPRRVA